MQTITFLLTVLFTVLFVWLAVLFVQSEGKKFDSKYNCAEHKEIRKHKCTIPASEHKIF